MNYYLKLTLPLKFVLVPMSVHGLRLHISHFTTLKTMITK